MGRHADLRLGRASPVDYLMLRGIFMPPGVTADQVAFYVDLLQEGPRAAGVEGVHGEGRLQADLVTGQQYVDWLGKNEQLHRTLMKEAGFLAN